MLELGVLPFVVIPVALVAALAWGSVAASRRVGESDIAKRRGMVVVLSACAWMTATWIAAEIGVLRRWEAMPPPFAMFVLAAVALAFLTAFSAYGHRLAIGVPLWTLVVIQGFRFPLELAMHAMYERGIMPEQMSYSGRNFDILTGVAALIVGPLFRASRKTRWLVVTWNAIGLGLLTNVVVIALLSTPRFHYFGTDRLNIWVTYPPFVWLPAIMVPFALAGHLVIFRALRSQAA